MITKRPSDQLPYHAYDSTVDSLSAHDVFSLASPTVPLLLDDFAGENSTFDVEDGEIILVHLLIGTNGYDVAAVTDLGPEPPEHCFQHAPTCLPKWRLPPNAIIDFRCLGNG